MVLPFKYNLPSKRGSSYWNHFFPFPKLNTQEPSTVGILYFIVFNTGIQIIQVGYRRETSNRLYRMRYVLFIVLINFQCPQKEDSKKLGNTHKSLPTSHSEKQRNAHSCTRQKLHNLVFGLAWSQMSCDNHPRVLRILRGWNVMWQQETRFAITQLRFASHVLPATLGKTTSSWSISCSVKWWGWTWLAI